MTGSGERSALDPDLVPVHLRVRELCGRFPEGPLPGAEVKALRDSIAGPRPGGRFLLPDRRTRTREDFEEHQRERRARLEELADMLRAASPGTAADLDGLSERLRELRDGTRLRFDFESLETGLEPERVRVVARHLLRTGITAVEVFVGLQLLETTAEPADTEMLSELALLGRSYAYAASKALRRLEFPAPHLFDLAMRGPVNERWTFASELARSTRADIDALLPTLSVGDAVALLRMTEGFQGMPKWLKGNERLAEAVVAASENPLLMATEEGPAMPASMVGLRDEVAYGKSALLGFSPGQRRHVIERLNGWLDSPRALKATGAAVARRPHDSDAIWMHRQVVEAGRGGSGDFPAGLAIRIAVPPPSTGPDVQTHLLIDGVPLIPRVFELGTSSGPEWLLLYGGGLRAETEPREVTLAEASCTEGCCGALRASIWRDEAAGRVEWETWRTRGAHEHRERFSFDAAAYDAEIARAAGDFTWEWPARRAARFLWERLEAEPELMSRWDCRPGKPSSWNRERSLMRLYFTYPGKPISADEPWVQFEHKIEIPDSAIVDDTAIGELVDGIVQRFRETDPKTFSRVCGGSREGAKALGFPWPGD